MVFDSNHVLLSEKPSSCASWTYFVMPECVRSRKHACACVNGPEPPHALSKIQTRVTALRAARQCENDRWTPRLSWFWHMQRWMRKRVFLNKGKTAEDVQSYPGWISSVELLVYWHDPHERLFVTRERESFGLALLFVKRRKLTRTVTPARAWRDASY